MAGTPLVYHKTFRSTDEQKVSDSVIKKVNQLRDDNYHKIRIIDHKPVLHTYSNGNSDLEFMTTIIATRDDVHIDIGFNSPA